MISNNTNKDIQLIEDNPSTTNILRKEINATQRELTCHTHTPEILDKISLLKSNFE